MGKKKHKVKFADVEVTPAAPVTDRPRLPESDLPQEVQRLMQEEIDRIGQILIAANKLLPKVNELIKAYRMAEAEHNMARSKVLDASWSTNGDVLALIAFKHQQDSALIALKKADAEMSSALKELNNSIDKLPHSQSGKLYTVYGYGEYQIDRSQFEWPIFSILRIYPIILEIPV